tara:strand:+ start:364 stop:630 length:267 start_codon:yes stop_codon:yes gene_type:complete
MSDEHAKKLAAKILRKFNSQGVLSKAVDSAFCKFDESKVFIPWYLKPFAKKIRAIACSHFVSGYFSNTTGASNTVAFKRPKAYESKLL